MRTWLTAAVLVVILIFPLWGQTPYKVLTRPTAPPRDVLHKLGLVKGWHTHVPGLRSRDGFYSVQIIPGERHPQLVLQTFSGEVILLDGETGDILWRNHPGTAYWAAQPVAFNSHSIFTTRRDELYILNRANGLQRLYTIEPMTKDRTYGMRLEGNPITGLMADETNLYVSLGDRIIAYEVPNYEAAERAKRRKTDEPKVVENTLAPEFLWGHRFTTHTVETLPLLTMGQVGVVATDGTFFSLNKFAGSERFDFRTTGKVTAPLGQHLRTAYIGSEDYALYALDIANERLQWRFLSGGLILRKPIVNDIDVYLPVERVGFFRIDRLTGRSVWLNKDVDHFLAANNRFVYTRDPRGILLVHDHARGVVLGKYDMSEWQIPLVNELTDRIYLANHDGQVLCLFHRDNPRPLKMKAVDVKNLSPEEEKKIRDDQEKEKEKEKIEGKMGRLPPARAGTKIARLDALPVPTKTGPRRLLGP